MTNNATSSVVRKIVALLVDADYRALEKLTNGERLTSGEIEQAVKDYGGTLIMPPDSAVEDLDIIEIENSSPRKWSVRFELWAAGEGRSDLSLELTLTESDAYQYEVEINGIHVL